MPFKEFDPLNPYIYNGVSHGNDVFAKLLVECPEKIEEFGLDLSTSAHIQINNPSQLEVAKEFLCEFREKHFGNPYHQVLGKSRLKNIAQKVLKGEELTRGEIIDQDVFKEEYDKIWARLAQSNQNPDLSQSSTHLSGNITNTANVPSGHALEETVANTASTTRVASVANAAPVNAAVAETVNTIPTSATVAENIESAVPSLNFTYGDELLTQEELLKRVSNSRQTTEQILREGGIPLEMPTANTSTIPDITSPPANALGNATKTSSTHLEEATETLQAAGNKVTSSHLAATAVNGLQMVGGAAIAYDGVRRLHEEPEVPRTGVSNITHKGLAVGEIVVGTGITANAASQQFTGKSLLGWAREATKTVQTIGHSV
jgi:hypothetical protein